MEQVNVVKGAYSGYCLRLIQTDFINPENSKKKKKKKNSKIFNTRFSCGMRISCPGSTGGSAMAHLARQSLAIEMEGLEKESKRLRSCDPQIEGS